MYDLIGDTHGHADALEQLLKKMGYTKKNGCYSHPGRQVIFLGDFLDRGPRIRELLGIVHPMLDSGAAVAVMGNHELNALAFHTPRPGVPGEFLRPHTPSNRCQHGATVEQLGAEELRFHLGWIRALPFWLDLEGLRVIHACWDERARRVVAAGLDSHGGVTDGFLHAACTPGGPLFAPTEVLLKGKEARLPEGVSFLDADGHERRSVRTRWYLAPGGHTYRTYALQTVEVPSDAPLEPEVVAAALPYPASEKPVFIGHYWLSSREPELLASNVACLDYSVAKDGFLCGYRWDGESVLDKAQFVRV